MTPGEVHERSGQVLGFGHSYAPTVVLRHGSEHKSAGWGRRWGKCVPIRRSGSSSIVLNQPSEQLCRFPVCLRDEVRVNVQRRRSVAMTKSTSDSSNVDPLAE